MCIWPLMTLNLQTGGGPPPPISSMSPNDIAMAEQLKQVADIKDFSQAKEVVHILSCLSPQVVKSLGAIHPSILQRLFGPADLLLVRRLGVLNLQVLDTLSMMEVALVLQMADTNGMSFILDTLQNMTQADPAVMMAIGSMDPGDTSKFTDPQELINTVLEKHQTGSQAASGGPSPLACGRGAPFRGTREDFQGGFSGRGGDFRGGYRGRGDFTGGFRGRGDYRGRGGDFRGGGGGRGFRGGFKREFQDGHFDGPDNKRPRWSLCCCIAL